MPSAVASEPSALIAASGSVALTAVLDPSSRPASDSPVITHPHFTGTGTRRLQPNGVRAIDDLFNRSFGA